MKEPDPSLNCLLRNDFKSKLGSTDLASNADNSNGRNFEKEFGSNVIVASSRQKTTPTAAALKHRLGHEKRRLRFQKTSTLIETPKLKNYKHRQSQKNVDYSLKH